MARLFRLAIVALLLGGSAWLFSDKVSIDGLDNVKVRLRDGRDGSAAIPVGAGGDSVRVASFNIQVFGQSKLGKPDVMETLAEIVRHFDVVAIQEIRSKKQDVMPRFVQLIESRGGDWDFVISRPLGRTVSTEQYAFVWNTQRVEIDPSTVYVVNDPHDRMHREPLVASFRVRGPPPEEAFTFTLINVHTDPDEVDEELAALDDVYRAVQNDDRGEDDVILLGDLNTDDRHRGELGHLPYVAWAIQDTPTNVTRTKQYDNILYHQEATSEYTGVADVFDFAREFRLPPDAAKSISDHLPVWAEFSIYEGGRSGVVAGGGGVRR